MGNKKVGIIVFVVLVLLAIAVFFISNISITPKEDTKKVADTTQGVSATSVIAEGDSNKTSQVAVTEEVTAEATAEVTEVAPTEAVQTTVVQAEAEEPTPKEGDIVLNKIIAEEKLSYSGAEQTSIGKVVDKSCYLSGSQVIYCLQIETVMGTAGEVVSYYCTYSTYSSVNKGEELSITYQQTTANTYSVLSVSKKES